MAKRGLKPKQTGREPNMLCPCNSGMKYKRCCGKFMKGTGTVPRTSANPKQKIDKGELIKQTTDIARFDVMQRTIRRKKDNNLL